jgi:uncharacterized small protein (DUF1192 family)
MSGDESASKQPAGFVIGQSLDTLSIEDIDEAIKSLHGEIQRLELAKGEKSRHLDAASALFKN